ncbi:hypothetical protein C8R46DRAFT_1077165 [Mycena filopes]|nr:hypothetical protein C8R46DRAFT_1077165 [Mycena filopes]
MPRRTPVCPLMADDTSILDVLQRHFADPATRERHVVECGAEHWTYEDLDVVSSGLALALEAEYGHGSRPTVAIIAENLPYTFALHLAVWKLGGIVAPIDPHTPAALLEPMLAKVAPTCVVVPATEESTRKTASESGFPLRSFTPEETTLTALCQRFLDATDLPLDRYPPPDPTSNCLYLFTSSASDVSNIKCVPLTHRTIIAQSRSMLQFHQNAYPSVSFRHLRVLGWGPFSHMIAMVDIATHVFLTGGCYVFGLTPSGYHARVGDATTSLLDAIVRYSPESLAAVPWVFENLKQAVESEVDLARRETFVGALRKFKLVWLGGAQTSAECIKWAKDHHVPLVLSIGMTEVGGGIFHRVAEENDEGWLIADRLISDAEFTLVDRDGKVNDSVGELHISSKLIAKGYLNHDSAAFAVAPDGVITFKTGDRYAKSGGRLKWLGRNDDFVQLVSGEMVDPRVLERTLDACPSISRACIVGNKFLRTSSQFLCAVIELQPDARHEASTDLDISRVIRAVNRDLSPPLRIPWNRVFVLDEGEQIPINRKGQIWRKKLESLFGGRVTALDDPMMASALPPTLPPSSLVRPVVVRIVAHALGLSSEILEANADSTFAELGMDSAAAVAIVARLNEQFSLSLPRNACHTHVDLNSLCAAISELLSHTIAPPQPTPPKSSGKVCEDIVIVGQAVKLPGDLNTPESFWEALVDLRENLLLPVPKDRWDHASFLQSPGAPSEPGDIAFERAGFVEIASFDNVFFGISSAEALSVAPAARLVLETTFQALENANIPGSSLKGTDTGVFLAGAMDVGYVQLMFAEAGFSSYTRFHGTGVANSASCGRLSYLLDVHGPSVSFETACSSGLVAFHEAVQYLQTGQAETAIVSGANTHTWPGDFAFLSAQKMSSPNSRCATFSSEADGYVPAEGAVSLILKTRHAAERDGNSILAVILATETKHNGKSQGLVAPHPQGQAALQRSLLGAASLSPSDIDFVEAHGTGTSLGDLIEIEGINNVFRGSHTPQRPLFVGAAKASIGHTEVVAGLVGIVKTIKQLSTGKVTGLVSLSSGQLNPEIDTTLVPLSIPSNLVDLPKRNEPYRALVVAYGFAGTLAGTILEAPPRVDPDDIANRTAQTSWMPFVVSAKSRDALHSYIQLYLDFCTNASPEDFRSICYTSCVGREHYRYRFSCVAKDLDGLIQHLRSRLSMARSATAYPPHPHLILAFPGQGSQFYGMAEALAARFPEFRRILVDAATRASFLAEFDVLALLLGTGAATDGIDRSAVAQICIFVYQYSVCQFLHTLGISPDAVIGNSLGEISAAVEAGLLSYELGLQFVVARAKILAPAPKHPAGMAAVATTAATIAGFIADLHLADRVKISVFSSEATHVVSGDSDALNALISHVKKSGARATLLNVDQGFHSHCIDTVLPQLKTWIAEHMHYLRPLERPLFSTVLGTMLPRQHVVDPSYWVTHARNPVLFQQAAAQIKEDKVFQTAAILDIGPTPTAWAALQSNSLPDSTLLCSSAKKGREQELAFFTAIAALVELGMNLDFGRLLGSGIRKTGIPTYPFQRRRHYPNFIPSRSGAASAQVPPYLVVDQRLFQVLQDHRINGDVVLPGAAMVDFFAQANQNHTLDIRFHRPWVLPSAGKSGKVNSGAGAVLCLHDGDTGDKLCSTTVSPDRTKTPAPAMVPSAVPPRAILSKDAVYARFGVHVQFGPLFQNIVSMHQFDAHVDGYMELTPSASPQHDRTRALDACIHMFGACRERDPNFVHGAFLPMALEGYAMHVDALPSSFLCRYRFPFVYTREGHVVSTAFEVLSHAGELLVSCEKYSVAWVEMRVPSVISPPPTVILEQVWVPQKHGAVDSALDSRKIIYFGRRCDWIESFTADASDGGLLFGFDDDSVDSVNTIWRSGSAFSQLLPTIDLANATVIMDVTRLDATPDSSAFSASWQKILLVMKALGRSRIRSFRFIVLSTPGDAAGPSILGPLVQGMLRVFRREVGLDSVYGVEVPRGAPPDVVADAVRAELRGRTTENMILYRYSGEAEERLTRFIPELHPVPVVDAPPSARLAGVAVIVGMGSIGFPLGGFLFAAGVSTVVFIGRRPQSNETIARQLATVAQFAYAQADTSDLAALRGALRHITATHGRIKHILHTAATVSDATIDSVTPAAFERVLRPKVQGAYNLHVLAEELALPLDSFVLFSSISVPLGNPGQVAYVAANAFLDALAIHRRARGLPGVALQLGPWESALVEGLSTSSSSALASVPVHRTTHTDGLPLIVRALMSPTPVLVIAALDARALARTPVYAADSLFARLVAGVTLDSSSNSSLQAPSAAAVGEAVLRIVRGVLGLSDADELDLSASLPTLGVDSIAFAQIRSAVARELPGVEVPLVYLSDALSVGDLAKGIGR